MEKWNRIQDIETLTAHPNQRAVVYKGQLLIIDWDYYNQSVEIQYQNLSNVKFLFFFNLKKVILIMFPHHQVAAKIFAKTSLRISFKMLRIFIVENFSLM